MEQAIEMNWGYGNYYVVFSQKIPEMYKNMGLQEAKIFMSSTIFEKIKYKHNIDNKTMLGLRDAIENPVAVIKSRGHLMVVTDLYDYRNLPVVAILGTADEGRVGNYVASVYGRKDVVNFLHSHVVNQDDDILFMDFDKIEQMRDYRNGRRIDNIKRYLLESRGCKLKMTIERDGKKVQLTEDEIWAAYSLVSENLTAADNELAEQIEGSVRNTKKYER